VPRFLGISAKIAKNFARIHKANLINFGILPITFVNPSDYDTVLQGDTLMLRGLRNALEHSPSEFIAEVLPSGKKIPLRIDVTDRERKILLAGGLINLATQR
jgi:aconitate hydratase